MNKSRILFILFTVSAISLIGWIFWQYELKYSLPTPVPSHFRDVKLGEVVSVTGKEIESGKPALLHFFNPDCPCSKFNMKHFELLSKKYGSDVNFYVVLQSEEDDAVEDFNDKYELSVPVILDRDGSISDQCGIYSTPQAVVLDKASVLYFKGNYNKARYCTRKETNYVQIALDSLIENKPLPLFVQNELTVPYGCSLPSDEAEDSQTFLNIF